MIDISSFEVLLDFLARLHLLEVHNFLIRNHFISNLLLDSLKFKIPLKLQGKAKKLVMHSTLTSLPGSS